MLIHSNQGNYEKCSIVIIRYPAIFSNWGTIQLIFCDKSPEYLQLPFSLYALQAERFKNFDAIWQPYLFYEEWSYMTDFHLIAFLDHKNLGIDTEIGFLSGTVSKLLDIWYLCDYANLC